MTLPDPRTTGCSRVEPNFFYFQKQITALANTVQEAQEKLDSAMADFQECQRVNRQLRYALLARVYEVRDRLQELQKQRLHKQPPEPRKERPISLQQWRTTRHQPVEFYDSKRQTEYICPICPPRCSERDKLPAERGGELQNPLRPWRTTRRREVEYIDPKYKQEYMCPYCPPRCYGIV